MSGAGGVGIRHVGGPVGDGGAVGVGVHQGTLGRHVVRRVQELSSVCVQ